MSQRKNRSFGYQLSTKKLLSFLAHFWFFFWFSWLPASRGLFSSANRSSLHYC